MSSRGYPFIEALSRGPAGGDATTAILDERHAEEQFERGLGLHIDGSCR